MNALAATANEPRSVEHVPLYVDLDGTLIRSDLLHENLLALVRKRITLLWRLPFWLAKGRAFLKARLAETCELDAQMLPYRDSLLEYLRSERIRGRELVLATAANERQAQRIAAHLGMFSAVLASTDCRNLKGHEKCLAILEHCAGGPFAYAGNGRVDLPIWARAREGIVVGANRRVAAAAHRATEIVREFDCPESRWLPLVRAMRPHQWLKNVLVFVPLLTAHLWASAPARWSALVAFLAFSLVASGGYIVNDLIDVPSDRKHPRKRRRPIASGAVSAPAAVLLACALFIAGLTLAARTSSTFLAVIETYVVITFGYTALLKKRIVFDAITLAGLYTIRVIGGAIAIEVTLSFWLLAFTMFFFFSLALTKRYSELVMLAAAGRKAASGRDYMVSDAGILASLGTGSGLVAVLVFALFINSQSTLAHYEHPELLWLLCVIILYWVARMWIKAGRGEMHDDPLVFAARDPNSLFFAVMAVAIVIAAA
jgi:4-hydroxybenzoate polyprenyltransferase/phosphoserine phosphatase